MKKEDFNLQKEAPKAARILALQAAKKVLLLQRERLKQTVFVLQTLAKREVGAMERQPVSAAAPRWPRAMQKPDLQVLALQALPLTR